MQSFEFEQSKTTQVITEHEHALTLLELREKRIFDMQNSTSWRVTAPLRWLGGIMKKGLFFKKINNEVESCESLTEYQLWLNKYGRLGEAEIGTIKTQILGFTKQPLFSVLLIQNKEDVQANLESNAVVNTVASLNAQLYDKWELHLTTDIVATLSHLSVLSEWLIKLNPGEQLDPKYFYLIAKALQNNNHCSLIYADEDLLDENGTRTRPHFKPDWDYYLHQSVDLIGNTGVYRSQLAKKIIATTWHRQETDRYIANIQANEILHLPYVLLHAPIANKTDVIQPEKKIQKAVGEIAYSRKSDMKSKTEPLVSIIIPTRNKYELIERCISSIQKKTSYQNYEIIVVDNGSDDADTLAYLAANQRLDCLKVLRIDAPFNFSKLNNAAVERANGEFICMLNNDTEIITEDWLLEMVKLAMRPNIGAVGAKLLYPNDTVQHAGVILGIGGVAGHGHKHIPRDSPGYAGRNQAVQCLSAVTAACLVVRKSIYQLVGGLNEKDLAVAFNDVDFCIRIRVAGYKNLWTPLAVLYHHESASRGYEDSPEKQQRFQKELSYMLERWGDLLQTDPAYNPNLTLNDTNFGLAYPPRTPSLMA